MNDAKMLPIWALMNGLETEIKEVEAHGYTVVTEALLTIRDILKHLCHIEAA